MRGIEKGLQKIGVGTLVSSKERRALAVPLINRVSTAYLSQVNCGSTVMNRGSNADFIPPSVYIVRASEKTSRTVLSIR